jgi:hypothetical protein
MKKTLIALTFSALALGASLPAQSTQAHADQACWALVAAACDWLYPSDTTLETEKKYGSCMVQGGSGCNSKGQDSVRPSNLKRMVETSPLPSASILKKYVRPGWQNASKKPSR